MAMKIYWFSYRNVPELAGLSSSERREFTRNCFWKFGFRHWQCWVAILAMSVLVAVGSVIGDIAQYAFGLPEPATWFTCALIFGMTGQLIYFNVLVRQLRPHFRDYIAERKVHA